MNELPTALYDAAGTRALDEAAITRYGVDGYDLMRRAGSEAYRVICRLWPDAQRITVICGSGNNGGDGYVVAELAAHERKSVRVVALSAPRSDSAARARAAAEAAGVSVDTGDEASVDECDLVVDAIFGTGLSRAPEGVAARFIAAVNASGRKVFSLDVPSGLNADNGSAPGAVVNAHATSTFIGLKLGLLTGAGPDFAGRVQYHDLGVPAGIFDVVPPVAERIVRDRVRAWLPRRRPSAHKGTQGHVVLVGGNDGMTGALRIAAEAAARSGAGLVTAATRSRNAATVNARQPEIMSAGVDDASALSELLEGKRAFAIGPGLGRDDWAAALFDAAARSALPAVIDADALNLLARSGRSRQRRILTPHPGEAARLLGCTIADIGADRPAAARNIAQRYDAVCVLKGCGTLVTDGESMYLCDAGNPGMATGGMGDCLTGVIAALLCQGLEPLAAAACGVWLHASAADCEARANGLSGMLATDLLPWLRRLMDPLDG